MRTVKVRILPPQPKMMVLVTSAVFAPIAVPLPICGPISLFQPKTSYQSEEVGAKSSGLLTFAGLTPGSQRCENPHISDKRGGFYGSAQHQLEVYLQGSQQLKSRSRALIQTEQHAG